MTMTREPIAPEDDATADSTARRWAAGHVIVAVVIALVVGTLLNAQSLLATAERQPFGWQRDMAVAFASPVASFSAAIGLDRPHQAIDTALGRTPDDGPVVEDDPDVVAQPTGEPRTPSEPATATPSPTASPTPTEPPGPMGLDRGPVTAEDPLTVYIAGDSMAEIQFGVAMEDLADDSGMIEPLALDTDKGSGLTRPDFIDWPARLAKASRQQDPDVMILYFGGNDAQPIKIDGTVYEPSAQEWQAEYRSRVADLMDQLVADGHHTYWMGLPIPRSDSLAATWTVINGIFSSEAEARDGVTFVDVWDLFAGPDGTYSEYLVDEDGDEQDMRLDDGIHLSTAGAYRAARPTLARIIEDFEIPASESSD